MRQNRVLLAFVEAVHLIHKHDGALRHQPTARRFGFLYGFSNVLDPAQHGTDGNELRIKRIGHQPGDGGFARARRPPEDAAVRAPCLKRQPQRHARAQHLLLAHHLPQRARAQTLWQRLVQCGAVTAAFALGQINISLRGCFWNSHITELYLHQNR